MSIEMERVHGVGKNSKSGTIVAKLPSHKTKQTMLNKTKNSTVVLLNEPYSRETMVIRKNLWEQMKDLRKQNNLLF